MSNTKTTGQTTGQTAANTTTSNGRASADATRMMEDAVRGWGQAMNTWMDAQDRLMSAAFASMPAMPSPEAFMPAGGEARRQVEQNVDRVRGGVSRVFHGSVELATANVNDMASMLTEQSRFMGRMTDRAVDCMMGENAARSPEAFSATVRNMMTDCVENATAVSEQMVRVGARSMDNARTMVESEVAAVAQSATPSATTTR